jgi:negative regulator of flagellin synthesis FlgM
MSMNIKGLTSTQSDNRTQRADQAKQQQTDVVKTQRTEAEAKAPSPQKAAETVHLSDNAKTLQQLEEKANRLPVVNKERVAELKAAYEAGAFEINSERVADAMLAIDDLF